jgi:hypothetical protein
MLKFFRPRNNSKEPLTVKGCEYYKYHTGLNGNVAYYANAKFGYRELVIEMIKLPDLRWVFHVECHDKMVLDSRLGNCFYDSPETAHSAMLNALSNKFNPQII